MPLPGRNGRNRVPRRAATGRSRAATGRRAVDFTMDILINGLLTTKAVIHSKST